METKKRKIPSKNLQSSRKKLKIVKSIPKELSSLSKEQQNVIIHFLQTSTLEQLKNIFQNWQKAKIIQSLRPFTNFDVCLKKFESIPCLTSRALINVKEYIIKEP